ncbi:hypothetical protein [uncultured Agrobacterium sp.]|uniref:hypothetical protein n=1 Tax=uncultured Agrobacterium sp. TaxID=157277 RepID=UPI0025CBD360|nr:hypothetical protein [uncultured Agrobacterium sp.]
MADQTKRIIYQNDQGGITVLIPPHDDDCDYSLEEIAAKDVPTGKPYAIIDASDVPVDRSERQGWSVDVADLTDGVGE